MKKLEHQNPIGDANGDIEDAEFEEIEPANGSRPELVPFILLDWWHERGFITRAALVLSPLLFLAMCAVDGPVETTSAGAANSTTAETEGPDIVAYIDNREPSGEGGVAMIDELPDSAAPVCDGEFIWAFNASSKSFTLSGGGGEFSSSGRYEFDGKTLNLFDVVETGSDGKVVGPAKSFSHRISRSPTGRILIGNRSYRLCAATGAGGNDRPLGESQTTVAKEPAATPNQTTQHTCKSIEGVAAEIVTKRTGSSVIEINIDKEEIVDGQVQCSGHAITEAGRGAISYSTSVSPQGRVIVTAVFIPTVF